MSIQDTVAKIKKDALASASFIVYRPKDQIVFGFAGGATWRAMYLSNGEVIDVMQGSNANKLLDEALRVVEAKGARLSIVVSDTLKDY